MMRTAGLPMYDFAELRPATDGFWLALQQELAANGLDNVPQKLTRPDDLLAFWQSGSLLLGQTCGYPLMAGLCGDARYVATPCYKTRFHHGPEHKSLIITHRNSDIRRLADARGTICAINMSDSNTGMNLLRLEIAKLGARAPYFSRVTETKAHRASMQAVSRGEADIAAIDCVSFALLEQIDPALTAQLTILAETETTPALPFITAAGTDASTLKILRAMLHSVIGDPRNRSWADRLMLDDCIVLPPDAYRRVREIEERAAALGYPHLQ